MAKLDPKVGYVEVLGRYYPEEVVKKMSGEVLGLTRTYHPFLACKMTEFQAVFVSHLHYLCTTISKPQADGLTWWGCSMPAWHRYHFPYKAYGGLRKEIEDLVRLDLVTCTTKFSNPMKYNTRWWRLNYDKVHALLSVTG